MNETDAEKAVLALLLLGLLAPLVVVVWRSHVASS